MKKIQAPLALVNILGALGTYIYFAYILPPINIQSDVPFYYNHIVFIVGTLFLATFFVLGSRGRLKHLFEIANGEIKIHSLDESEVYHLQRESLQLPMKMAIITFMVWILAGFMYGILEPIITAKIFDQQAPDIVLCVRRFFGIALLGGGVTSLILYFVIENTWRTFVPKFFPEGHLNRIKHVFKLSVQKRFLIVFLGITLIPLPVLVTTIYFDIKALHLADAITRTQIIASLVWEMSFIIADSFCISLILAYLLSKSISEPLLRIKKAIKEVENNNLDSSVEIVSNDEIGDVAEGFNLMIKSLKETQGLKESFGKYVCREIRDEIVAGKTSLDGEMKRATLLFSDLRNFTTLVEKNHPTHVVTIMNQYFNEMTAAVKANRGLILQYVGDEIEAVFGAPVEFEDHPDMAVKTALEMRKRLDALNLRLEQQGFEPLAHGIGIHSGAVLAGNIGSEERMSYALVGDTVNTASRIEGLTKEYGCDTILSQTTYNLLTESYKTEQLPPVKVKGKEDGLIIYKLLG